MSQTTLDADVCIFGGGAAGLFLAERLTRDPQLHLVLVEAGASDYSSRKEPYTVGCRGRKHLGVNEARITSFGGATNTWGGGLIRLDRDSLSGLPNEPHTAWPIDYRALERGYSEAERTLGIPSLSEPSAVPEYACEGLKYRRRPITVLPFRKKNFARTFGRTLRSRPNFQALFETDVLADAESADGKLQMVKVRSLRKGYSAIRAKVFVLAAGIVNSVLLADQLYQIVGARSRAPALGAYFHDHVSIPLFRVHPISADAFSRRFGYRFEGGLMYGEHYESDSLGLNQSRTADAFFHFAYDFSASPALRSVKSLLEMFQRPGVPKIQLGNCVTGCRDLAKTILSRLFHGRLYVAPDVKVTGILDLEQVPRPDWRIDIPTDRSQTGCDLTWDLSETDIRNAREHTLAMRSLVRSLASEAPFSSEELFPDPIRSPVEFDAYVRAVAWDTYHACGGLRMGVDPETSVVAPSLALHHLPNVYALSTAVFPRAGAANPTLTLLALACAVSEEIAGKKMPARHQA